jgi:hypothetical protein
VANAGQSPPDLPLSISTPPSSLTVEAPANEKWYRKGDDEGDPQAMSKLGDIGHAQARIQPGDIWGQSTGPPAVKEGDLLEVAAWIKLQGKKVNFQSVI